MMLSFAIKVKVTPSLPTAPRVVICLRMRGNQLIEFITDDNLKGVFFTNKMGARAGKHVLVGPRARAGGRRCIEHRAKSEHYRWCMWTKAILI